jgi:hypothetical protein
MKVWYPAWLSRTCLALIAALAFVIATVPGSRPAAAQWADPVGDSLLSQILNQQVIQSSIQNSSLVKQISELQQQITSATNLVQQTQDWTKTLNISALDHLTLPGNGAGATQSLLQSILQNNNLMTTMTNSSGGVATEMQQLLPHYQSGQSYIQYMSTLNANTYAAYNQAMGVADSSITNEDQVMQSMYALPTSTNQLEALQTLVQMARIQAQQMDKLIKIQGAMMKSMALAWGNEERKSEVDGGGGAGSGSLNMAGNDITSAIANCQAQDPYLMFASGPVRMARYKQCQANESADTGSVNSIQP